jgi:hypothetical protein
MESNDIVTRLRLRPTILRKNRFGDMETDRAATALFDDCHAIMREAADEIERLRAERDEARREVSYLRPSVTLGAQTAVEYAKSRGWDCFKEER